MSGYGTVPQKGGYAQPQHGYPVAGVPLQPLPTETWTAGVCDCFQDMGLCCDVCWCTCCQAGRIYDAVEDRPDSMNVPVCLGLLVMQYFIGGVGTCLFTMCMRDKVRHKYGIMGDGCDDCCVSFWCTPCTLCQLHRELSKRGTSPGYVCCEPSVRYTHEQQPIGAQPGYAPGGYASAPVQYK